MGVEGLSGDLKRQLKPLSQTAHSVAGLGVFDCAGLAHESALIQKAGERTERARFVFATTVAAHGAHIGRILERRAATFEGVAKAIGRHDGVGFKLERCVHVMEWVCKKEKSDFVKPAQAKASSGAVASHSVSMSRKVWRSKRSCSSQ